MVKTERGRKLDTFPSTYGKDYKFYDFYKKATPCGTYEPFTLGEADKNLFRPLETVDHISEDLDLDDLDEDLEEDPLYMKSVYMADFSEVNVYALRQLLEKKSLHSFAAERASHSVRPPPEKPVEPLSSSLRVCPGPPRYYRTCYSEYQDTYEQVGRLMFQGIPTRELIRPDKSDLEDLKSHISA